MVNLKEVGLLFVGILFQILVEQIRVIMKRFGGLMQQRTDYRMSAPEGIATLQNLQNYVDHCGLERSLLELVKTRASQINSYAFCLDMHTRDARAAGESEQRLYLLSAWREAPFYSERERAALAWTEAVTRLATDLVDDALYEELRRHFAQKEIVDLTLAIIAINGWNRLAVSFRAPPGSYQPASMRGHRQAVS